jgi:hypothetical protein
MADDPIQILEVRADSASRSVVITVAVTADAAHAIFIALSEQLDRRRRHTTASVEDVLTLRQQTELVERFAPLAASRAHAIVQLNEQELRDCLLDLSDYRERVDGEHFQPAELRQRLRLTAEITGILWDANATVAAALDELLSEPAQ